MSYTLALVITIVVVAFIFDYTNGFHDAANSIATVVSTRVLSPNYAVAWAAFFNFIAFLLLGTRVAKTIGGDLVHIEYVQQDLRLYMVLAGILGAIAWNLMTWYVGLPTSSSHALIGGYGGAAIAAYGSFFGILKPEGWIKTTIFIVASPLIGMILGWAFMIGVHWIFRKSSPRRVDKFFRRGQLFSAAAYSIGHGGNDAQKTMGIITAALVAGGALAPGAHGKSPEIPMWVVLGAQAAIALGTLSGGWRIVKTMGSKITKLKPIGGFSAETAGAISLFSATLAGIPVSTTHTITGAIVGVGATHRLSAVRWGIARRIVYAWILTIPMAAGMSALFFYALRAVHNHF
jgi:inorganic phosphate transporter, PiT family